MLDEFLYAAYRQEQQVAASTKLAARLEKLPIDVLQDLAAGIVNEKTACYATSDKAWLDTFQGTPLMEQAIDLERQGLQLEAETDSASAEERAERQARDDARDALNLRKRMLTLDLSELQAKSGQPAVPSSAQAAPGADAPAVGTEVTKAAAVADPVLDAVIRKYPELRPKGGASEKRANFAGFETPEEAHAAIAAIRADAEREEAHPVRTRLTGALGRAAGLGLGAGALGGLLGGPRAAALSGAAGALAGGLMGGLRRPGAADRRVQAALEQDMTPSALHATATDLDATAADIDANPGKYRLRRGLLGATTGGALGALAGKAFGHPGVGLLAGTALGAGAALPKPSGADFRTDAAAIRGHLAKQKEAGVIGSVMQGGKGLLAGGKGLATGAKNLATSSYAAGGLPQVAKSFGNVAKGFAQQKPLAAAGIAAAGAGLGGMALGRATAPKQPQVVVQR